LKTVVLLNLIFAKIVKNQKNCIHLKQHYIIVQY